MDSLQQQKLSKLIVLVLDESKQKKSILWSVKNLA